MFTTLCRGTHVDKNERADKMKIKASTWTHGKKTSEGTNGNTNKRGDIW